MGGNVCFIKIHSKDNNNTLLSVLPIFMKQTLFARLRAEMLYCSQLILLLNLGKIQLDNAISPAVVAAVAAAGYDSDSDIEQQQQTTAASATSGSRSRQKKFIKNFKQLPQEEVVLQSKCVFCFVYFIFYNVDISNTKNKY